MRTPDKEVFLKNISDNGIPIGNKTLREKLKFDDEKYWRIRDELLQEGLIKKASGKGGSVVKISDKTETGIAEKQKTVEKESFRDEKSLYKPFLSTIEDKFTKDMSLKSFVIADINSQGRKNTGGLWTRPDIVLISVNSYSYYPGKVMDIFSFEIKHYKNVTVAGVFETASHSRFATKSYYCLYLPQGWEATPDSERIRNECERFGIGLLYFSDPNDYDSFDTLVEPERKEPDPADMDEFIRVQLKEEKKNKLSELLR